jgi:hypothetical protein
MKWLFFTLFICSQAYAECLDMVMANWRLNIAEKTLSLVNFAPQSIKICDATKKVSRFIMETQKADLIHLQSIELPQRPKNTEIKTTTLDIYFEAPLPVWAKKSNLKIKESATGEVMATGEMK